MFLTHEALHDGGGEAVRAGSGAFETSDGGDAVVQGEGVGGVGDERVGRVDECVRESGAGGCCEESGMDGEVGLGESDEVCGLLVGGSVPATAGGHLGGTKISRVKQRFDGLMIFCVV